MPLVYTDWRCLRTGGLVASKVTLAKGWWQRSRGLLGRRWMEPGEGLWLDPCRQIHTFFMKFPLDAVFLDQGLVVVGLSPGLPPGRLTPFYLKARSCLELAAGAAEGLRPGDQLTFKQG